METRVSDQEKRTHVVNLIDGFSTAMLVTHTAAGDLRARPLTIADHDQDGRLVFSTAIESGKVDDLEHNPNVVVVMQDSRRFVSLSGWAHVDRDPALIRRLWSESWRVWFPGGQDDPSLSLLIVEPIEASYWDASGAKGLRYLYEMARGYLTHTRPAADGDERHTGHVKL